MNQRTLVDCECKAHAYTDGSGIEIEYCDLHTAAPDLLEACKEFVRKCESGEASSKRSYAQMKAAIAKSEGKP